MKKIVVIFGTRPEAIKMAPIIKELGEYPDELEVKSCVTAQHREMLDQVLELFDIQPDYDLGIMRKDQSLFDITTRGLTMLADVLEKEKPKIILVQGDTTTTFVGSLAAYYLKMKVGHVEAGLRTGDKFDPFPEEVNRRLTDVISDLYFAPTDMARENLLKEGIEAGKIFVTGNTVVDALLYITHRQFTEDEFLEELFVKKYNIPINGHRLILVTSHRRESFGQDIVNICNGLESIVERNDDVEIIYPVHLNPNVREPVNRILGKVERVHLIEPLDYASFVWLMSKSYMVFTDSGGVQEEAPALGKPVLVMRKKTERPEGIQAGTARLVGTDSESIFAAAQELLDSKIEYEKMAKAVNPYGDGKAAEKIVAVLRGTMA